LETDEITETLADMMRKAHNIGVKHANSRIFKVPKDQFIDTYFSGPTYAALFVEYQLERSELHDIYKRAHDKQVSKNQAGSKGS
jgi:hypothetical protein